MSAIDKISIALPTEMVTLIRDAVDAGEYASSSEVVREALREWSYKRQLREHGIEELRAIWQQARTKNGPYVPAADVLQRLELKYQTLADAAGE
ncbi:antitoxin ParD1/3/4 [Bryocella elongata]|uniref:Antitoxin ParD1/3/4 n=1 Tax=Bryocella elongata TaxID=863522 RepID=A0A1H6BF98_9BACT|nr:type II toxin-antitoxin system ParD family antitoxin [Bryocella elongata]SEG59431.1 antitoxin ParD1/3/4 [Bryocella elongata]